MPLYNAPNLSAGLDEAIIGTVQAIPIFTPMLLFFVWGVVFLGGMTAQKRTTGSGDMPMWMTIAMISTLFISLSMTLASGLIQIQTISIVAIITIFSGLWLFMDRNRREV